MTPRIAKLLRRRRICWAAGPSAAFFPSSDGGSELLGPIVLTFSPETREIEYGAYSGDGRLACPLILQKVLIEMKRKQPLKLIPVYRYDKLPRYALSLA